MSEIQEYNYNAYMEPHVKAVVARCNEQDLDLAGFYFTALASPPKGYTVALLIPESQTTDSAFVIMAQREAQRLLGKVKKFELIYNVPEKVLNA